MPWSELAMNTGKLTSEVSCPVVGRKIKQELSGDETKNRQSQS